MPGLRGTVVAALAGAAFALAALAGHAAAQQAGAYERLPVPSVTIYPGDAITDAMIIEQHFLPGTRQLYPVIDARSALVGKVARRTLLPGRLIPANAVSEPELVTRGSLTKAVFENGGLTMTTVVLPLQSGSLGDLVQARNVDSKQVIAGIVQADGTVRVGAQ
jgi:flagella basal body P-ring formation protein FlgA